MPVAAVIVVAAVAGITFWVAADGEPSPEAHTDCAVKLDAGEHAVDVGDQAPVFALPQLDGDCFDVATYRGRPLLVNFWASWCHPCRTEFPLLRDARDRYGDDGLEVIGVVYRDITPDARAFADERDVQWPLVLDDDQAVADAFGVTAIPQTFFIAADGTVVAHLYGLTSERELRAEIRRTLRA